LVTSSTNLRL